MFGKKNKKKSLQISLPHTYVLSAIAACVISDKGHDTVKSQLCDVFIIQTNLQKGNNINKERKLATHTQTLYSKLHRGVNTQKKTKTHVINT